MRRYDNKTGFKLSPSLTKEKTEKEKEKKKKKKKKREGRQ